MMRWKTTFQLTICALALGCGDDDSPAGDDTAEQASTEGTEGEGGDASGTEGPEHDDRPPVLESFTVDGSTTPPLLTEPAFVKLSVVAVDDIGLDYLEFLVDDAVLAKLEAPSGETSFSHRWLVSGAEFDGTHRLAVRAVDLAGNVAESSAIELLVDQPRPGLRSWVVTKDHGSGDVAHACALIQPGRLLVGGTALRKASKVPDASVQGFFTSNGSPTEDVLPKIGEARLRAIARLPDHDTELVLAGTKAQGYWLASQSLDGTVHWLNHPQLGAGLHVFGGLAVGLDRLHVGVTVGSKGRVVTYDATGTEVGQREFGDTVIRDIAILDPGGDLIVVGEREGDIFLARSSTTGESRWTAVVDGGHGHDEALAVSVGPDGRFAVVGSISGDGTGLDTWLRVYDGDGVEQWTAEPYDRTGGPDILHGVAVDPLGRVVVTGRVTTNPKLAPVLRGDIHVASYEADGTPRWMARPAHGPSVHQDVGHDVCIDEVGNVYVVGAIGNEQDHDWWIARHAP
ncbi:MAG: hypothetical protein HC927_03015 [Deltaproteobacteria bacterium]|nr:hypothetical protein [Deltaproteobacteria bacterium]